MCRCLRLLSSLALSPSSSSRSHLPGSQGPECVGRWSGPAVWLVTLELTPPWSRQSGPCTLRPTHPCSFTSQMPRGLGGLAHSPPRGSAGAQPPRMPFAPGPPSTAPLLQLSAPLALTAAAPSLGPGNFRRLFCLIWAQNLTDLRFCAQFREQAESRWVVALNG